MRSRWTSLRCGAVLVLLAPGVPLAGQVGVGTATGVTSPGAGAKARLLVLSKREHTLAIVDPMTLRVEARVPVGEDPHEVIAAADGRRAYVSNYGFGAFHTLAVVDLESGRALPPVDLGALTGPHGLAVQGGEVWFTAEGAKVVGRYDPAAQKVDLVLGTGQDRTHMIAVTPDGEHVMATNVSSGTVSFLDRVDRLPPPGPSPGGGPGGTSPGEAGGPGGAPPPGAPPMRPGKDWKQTVVKVGNGSEGFDVSPDGRVVWVGNAQDGTVSVIDRASRQVLLTLPLNASGVNRLKFTLDGKFVLLSGVRGESPLWVVDADTHAVVKKLAVGRGAAGILMEPGGRRAFVACSRDGYAAVVDLRSLELTGKIEAGAEPDGMAWASVP